MNLHELKSELRRIKALGYIETKRGGSTGIGHTLEQVLSLEENNLAIPDIGGRVELKATRKRSSSLITLFTFNNAVWKVPQKEIVAQFGYKDQDKKRVNLYNTIWPNRVNSLGFLININNEEQRISMIDPTNRKVAEWNIYSLVAKFLNKFNTLFLFVLADSRETNGKEEFHYNEAYLLKDTSPENFINAFQNSKVGLDLRMHIKPNGSIRNHGTGFRIHENDFSELFSIKERIL
ncbi:MAG: MvaI/BcnI family restriction endonuclease [candidate division WOR-3 bacterium]|nr:MvaI/BcnI family restriction endonuclease [candidate division WOR-3 bacterium]